MSFIKHLEIIIGFGFVVLLGIASVSKPPLPRAQAVAHAGDMAIVFVIGKRMSAEEKQRSLAMN